MRKSSFLCKVVEFLEVLSYESMKNTTNLDLTKNFVKENLLFPEKFAEKTVIFPMFIHVNVKIKGEGHQFWDKWFSVLKFWRDFEPKAPTSLENACVPNLCRCMILALEKDLFEEILIRRTLGIFSIFGSSMLNIYMIRI